MKTRELGIVAVEPCSGYPLCAERDRGKTNQQAAVKGARRPAERTLEGCVPTHPRGFTMALAGRPAAGLDAP